MIINSNIYNYYRNGKKRDPFSVSTFLKFLVEVRTILRFKKRTSNKKLSDTERITKGGTEITFNEEPFYN